MQREAGEFYHPDDCLPEQSDYLAPVVPKYRHDDTPPPLVSADSSVTGEEQGAGEEDRSDTGSPKRRPAKRKRRRRDPNRPDIAQEAANDPLERSSDEELESESMSIDEDEAAEQHGQHGPDKLARSRWTIADIATTADQRFVRVEKLVDVRRRAETSTEKGAVNGLQLDCLLEIPLPQPYSPSLGPPQPKTPLNLIPPPLSAPRPPLSVNTSRSPHFDGNTTGRAPNLARHAIEGDRDSQLPPMQMSPPRSSSGQSPESSTTLPSLSTALSMDSTGSGHFSFPGQSPNRNRILSGQHFGPSPSSYSHPSPGMSPPSFLPTLGPYRTSTQEGSISTGTPSEYNQGTPASIPTPATTTSSSTSYATPAAPVQEAKYHHHSLSHKADNVVEATVLKHAISVSPTSATRVRIPSQPQTNGASLDSMCHAQSLSANTFHCSYPGCTAAPFQTQYLLNSHANVHSNSRPHYCPVEDCPRGPGGRGFKRKNEMIRHGLVHASPGYVCPFCPDQQHKYPRPDNLQRHVRVHHTDRDRDDPLLREVLAARPEGSTSSGRLNGNSSLRRRSNSTRASMPRPPLAVTASTAS